MKQETTGLTYQGLAQQKQPEDAHLQTLLNRFPDRQNRLVLQARFGSFAANRAIDFSSRPQDPAQRIEWYQAMFNAKGLSWDPNVNVIGLRGVDASGKVGNAFNKWNDTIVVISNTPKGWLIREFAATTDPGITVNKEVFKKAPATLPTGQYAMQSGTYKRIEGAGVFVAPKIAVWRDFDHNGSISEQDKKLSQQYETSAPDIKLHWVRSKQPGDEIRPAVNGSSAGCQVPFLTEDEFHRLITPELNRHGGKFTYTLVDGRDRMPKPNSARMA